MALLFLKDFANDAESTQNYVIVASLKSETMGKLTNRIPGLRLSMLPLRMLVESLRKSRDVNNRSQSLAR